MIGVLDLDIGNLRSVCNAVSECGFEVEVVNAAARFDDLNHLIMPGVGHFGRAVRRLSEEGLAQPLRDFAASGRPMLGLCVGMQLLASAGTEGGWTPSLDLVPGSVMRFDLDESFAVPHVGWNEVVFKREHPLFSGIKAGRDFYFVHSYHFVCNEPDDVLTETDYGSPFASAVGRGNVVGFQFHPEKSQVNGLTLLENFCRWDGMC